jgi:hypothetical protein
VVPRHVQDAEPERGAPVHVANLVAGGERAHVAGLETLSLHRRDVVADEGLRSAGAGRAPDRGDLREHRHLGVRLTVTGLAGGEAERLPAPEVDVAEPQLLADGARQVEGPVGFLAGAKAEKGVVASPLGPDVRRQRLQQLHQRQRLVGPESHGDGHALALDQTVGRHAAADLPGRRRRPGEPSGGERDHQRHRHEHELGPPGEDTQEERPADEGEEGKIEGGGAGDHDGSAAGAGTW